MNGEKPREQLNQEDEPEKIRPEEFKLEQSGVEEKN